MKIETTLLNTLKKQTNIKELNLEIPPSEELGDYSLPCFSLAKVYKKNPNEIALELSSKIKSNILQKIEVKGPYLNFFIKKELLIKEVLNDICKTKENYGKSKEGKNKTILIDMSSPNIAKPFGIGHLRSTIIGNSLSNILSKRGFKVIKINYLGDWGTQFGKLIVGYKRFGNETLLKKEPINHMLDLYVKANNQEFEEEARNWFKKLEEGNKEALKLWKKFRELSLKDFNKIYKLLNIKFNKIIGESYYNKKMNSTINELNKKNLLEKSDGALVVNLEKYNLGLSLIQKSDGATLYATRDITAAIDRYKTYPFHKMIYEVGSEQKLHFKQFFKILELMGYKWAKDCIHVDHGLYLDKDGKKFATRKGKTIFIEDILNKTISLAKKTIQEKNPSLKNKDEVARKIAISAIFYGDLKNNRTNDIIFDIERFLDFEGETGPYIQYSYVRIQSILRKTKFSSKINYNLLEHPQEYKLIKHLSKFPFIIEKAYSELKPNIIANYVFSLSHLFNEYYHSCNILKEKNDLKNARLVLIYAIGSVIKSSLDLLGIETLKEM
ncbi:MAG: arginine--tRNA ligase [archaeon]